MTLVLAGADILLAVLNRSVSDVDTIGLPGEIALLGLLTSTVGALIASRVRSNPIGWVFCFLGLGLTMSILAQDYAIRGLVSAPGSLPASTVMAWLGSWLLGAGPVTIFVLLLFPDGRLPSPRWRPVAWLAAASTVGMTITAAVYTAPPGMEDLDGFHGPTDVGGVALVTFLLSANAALVAAAASAVAVILRLRRAAGDERQQLKWFVSAAGLLVVSVLVPLEEGAEAVILVAFAGIPLSTGFAVLKYRLYDIDLVINKTVVFATLAAFITTVYAAIVVGVGAAVGETGRSNVGLSLVATAVVAVAFEPVRSRAQRLANRLVYGTRATPYEVLSELSQRMSTVASTEDVLSRMARILTEGTAAAETKVWLRVGQELRVAASWPDARPNTSPVPLSGEELPSLTGWGRSFAVRHQGELLGALTVRERPGEPLARGEEALTADLAAQAGLVLSNVRLTTELRARVEEVSSHAQELRRSRERIVAAQDAERRRLERDLHDGAQQQLVGLMIKLRMAEELAGRDAPEVGDLLTTIKEEAKEALETLRDLARGIYPPLLAHEGLATALAAQARKAPLPVEVEAGDIGRFAEGTEAAVYFCCLEALQNVSKYAAASGVVIRIWREEDRLCFSVCDDGTGFDPERTPRGSGLQNMSDRLSALGGSLVVSSSIGAGTTLQGRLPIEAPPD